MTPAADPSPGRPSRAARLLVVAPPSIHSDRWCDHIKRNGFVVERLEFGGSAPGALPRAASDSRLAAAAVGVRQIAALRRRLRASRPDLVQAHWLSGPGWLTALVGARPLVVTAWGSDALIDASRSWIARALTRLVGRRADVVTFDAAAVGEHLATLGVPSAKLRRVVFGVDASRFTPGPRNTELLARLGVHGDAFVVLSPRGLRSVYEPETVIRGFASADLGDDARLLVRVGPDSTPWGDLADVAAQLRIADRVVPYEGVDAAELPDLLRSSDVVVSVPSSDGSSVILLETLFCERPVVVSDLPANREWVQDEAWGRIVPARDTEALAEALVWVRAHPTAAREAAAAAAAHAREHGDSATEFGRAASLYRELLGP